MILCAYVTPETAKCDFLGRHYDIIEMFAGTAKISRLGQASGLWALPHDRDYDRTESQHGAMDLNGSAGFAQLDLNRRSKCCLDMWTTQYATAPFTIYVGGSCRMQEHVREHVS